MTGASPAHGSDDGETRLLHASFCPGNPFGLDHTLTTGVISGVGREISSGINGRPIQGVIQIDAAINVRVVLNNFGISACCAVVWPCILHPLHRV